MAYQPNFWEAGNVIVLDKVMNLENGVEILDLQLKKILLTYELVKLVIEKENEGKILMVKNGHIEAVGIEELL